jgi:broad specificity phosphatase PhoE
MKQKLINTIILIRHGESDYNIEGIIQGNSNFSDLTTRGIKQAVSIGEWISELEINCIYTSPLTRAKRTAELISKECGYPVNQIIVDKHLIEVDFCSWQGKKRDYIKETNPELYKFWRRRPYDLEIDNRNPIRELYDRISLFLNAKIYNNNEKGTKVIIGHKGTISAILVSLLKLPKSHHHFMQIDRGSVTVLQERISTTSPFDYELIFANELPKEEGANIQPVNYKTEERTISSGELYLIRHGLTSSNIDKKYQGSKDIPLSNIGIRDMSTLAKSFLPHTPTRIYSSPLKRAIESAKIIAHHNELSSISVRNDLHEFIYGVWEGMTENDVIKYRNAEYNQWQSSPSEATIPRAEHINNAYNRCSKIWEDFQTDIESWNGSIISVAHDIVNRLIICNALDLPANYIWAFKQTNASVSVIAVKNIIDGRLRILNHSTNPLKSRLSDEWL